MKRWEVVAKALVISEMDARMVCNEWGENPDDEMNAPTPDLGRDIAIAILVAGSKASHDHWIDVWTRLTGRAKEGE